MAKQKLMSLTIRRNPNGGHAVTHEYAKSPSFTPGKSGGMGMDEPAPESHSFKAGDHSGLLNHIAAALSLKSMQKGPGAQQGGLPEA